MSLGVRGTRLSFLFQSCSRLPPLLAAWRTAGFVGLSQQLKVSVLEGERRMEVGCQGFPMSFRECLVRPCEEPVPLAMWASEVLCSLASSRWPVNNLETSLSELFALVLPSVFPWRPCLSLDLRWFLPCDLHSLMDSGKVVAL